jgi:phthiodiolone/phenolphthiodiolone dimycocerosates ketoreductase
MLLLLPGALWRKHGLDHPLGPEFEGFPDFVPEEVTPEHIENAYRQATPELLGDGVIAGNIDEVVDEIRGLVGAGLRHVVIWNVGPLASGAGPADLLRLGALVRRLRRIAV